MTGWRLGYAVLPTVEEAMVFRQLNINIISCTLLSSRKPARRLSTTRPPKKRAGHGKRVREEEETSWWTA